MNRFASGELDDCPAQSDQNVFAEPKAAHESTTLTALETVFVLAFQMLGLQADRKAGEPIRSPVSQPPDVSAACVDRHQEIVLKRYG
jgi:hypothetical protein